MMIKKKIINGILSVVTFVTVIGSQVTIHALENNPTVNSITTIAANDNTNVDGRILLVLLLLATIIVLATFIEEIKNASKH